MDKFEDNLNTSNVKVQHIPQDAKVLNNPNLNTSNVKVQQKAINKAVKDNK